MDYSSRLAARVLLYASSHRQFIFVVDVVVLHALLLSFARVPSGVYSCTPGGCSSSLVVLSCKVHRHIQFNTRYIYTYI